MVFITVKIPGPASKPACGPETVAEAVAILNARNEGFREGIGLNSLNPVTRNCMTRWRNLPVITTRA
jgi:hypothetical protein